MAIITAVSRLALLQRIVDHLQMYTQWVGGYPVSHDYLQMAEALIEVLEIQDCGSVGGYDKTNPRKCVSRNVIFDRYLTLIAKHPSLRKHIKVSCGYTLVSLQEFYDTLADLRKNTIQGNM